MLRSPVEKIGPFAYKLQLPEGASIYPVFHVSLLKRYHNDGETAKAQQAKLPPFTYEEVVVLEPLTILDTRWIKQEALLFEESLVQWKHLPAEEAKWEPTKMLLDIFPNVDPRTRICLMGGDDRPRHSKRGLKPNPKYLG